MKQIARIHLNASPKIDIYLEVVKNCIHDKSPPVYYNSLWYQNEHWICVTNDGALSKSQYKPMNVRWSRAMDDFDLFCSAVCQLMYCFITYVYLHDKFIVCDEFVYCRLLFIFNKLTVNLTSYLFWQLLKMEYLLGFLEN